ncbi:hypothetical protein [Marinomonas transparens]|uniref:Uncharacterized protein n=1 Tax=Marinomonas transparens TaxID=2795388 RepID=A0A934JSL6_9GAMM|nr:hypothetical protein [Marinomonas transparens]MBJ7539249.1 hypothetical protein [Marinomonas transparens]
MKIQLQPFEKTLISITGESFVYLDGAHSLELQASGKRAEIPSGSQVRFPKFNEISIQNKGDTELVADVIICEGEFRKLFEGATISAEIINTVDVSGSSVAISGAVAVSEMPVVDVSGSSVAVSGAVAVSEMPVVDVSGSSVAVSGAVAVSEMPLVDVSGSSVAVSEMPLVDVSGSSVAVSELPEIKSAATLNMVTSEYALSANSSLTIAGRVNRKRLLVQGYSESEKTTLCRISHTSATANTGAILPCGGGLMGEIAQHHSAAVKVWNPSGETISIHVLEEF